MLPAPFVGAPFMAPAAPTGLDQVHDGSLRPASPTWHHAAVVLPAQPAGAINRAPTHGCGCSCRGGIYGARSPHGAASWPWWLIPTGTAPGIPSSDFRTVGAW